MTNWPLMKDAITSEDKQQLIEFIQSSNRFTNGPRVREFETKWADWVGSKHALMVSSGSTANFLMLAALKEYHGWQPGDKSLKIDLISQVHFGRGRLEQEFWKVSALRIYTHAYTL